jgi:hypothetical protein
MSITATAHSKMKDWLRNKISHGTYTIGGVEKSMPIRSLTQSGDVATLEFYLDDSVSGTITKFKVIDTDGDVFDDQPDAITKPALNGLLITFKYTLKRV